MYIYKYTHLVYTFTCMLMFMSVSYNLFTLADVWIVHYECLLYNTLLLLWRFFICQWRNWTRLYCFKELLNFYDRLCLWGFLIIFLKKYLLVKISDNFGTHFQNRCYVPDTYIWDLVQTRIIARTEHQWWLKCFELQASCW